MGNPEPRELQEQRELMEDLLGRTPDPDSDPGPCPDESVLAAIPEGNLPPEERESVERHLAGCEQCLSVVAVLLQTPREPESECEAPRRRPEETLPAWTWAAAAVVLVLAAAAVVRSILTHGPGGSAPGTDEAVRLFACAQALGAADPTRFAGFKPLDEAERLSVSPLNLRGAGAALIHPRGKILETRPLFAWHPGTGIREARVQLLSLDLDLIGEYPAHDSPFSLPAGAEALRPGNSYAWKLVFTTHTSGREALLADFTIASDAEKNDFLGALAEIDARVARPLANLVKAHYALRRGFLAVAETAARDYLAEHPASPVGRQTLYHVLVKLESPLARSLDVRTSRPREK